jgi:small neutral amino acid transporter SnatA (MarC family)
LRARSLSPLSCFFFFVLVAGTPVLRFFGISLPIVEVAGGFVLAAMG